MFKLLTKACRLALALFSVVLLVGTSTASTQDVVQGYAADQPIQNGTILRLIAGSEPKVEPLPQEHETDMFGVAVAPSGSPVSLSDPSKNQVYAANLGRYDVLVSTQNGMIKAGDGIVISSLSGVGMKADDVHEVIVGYALADFGGGSDAVSSAKLDDGRTVSIGRVAVDIAIKRNSIYSGDDIAGVPHLLSRAARAVTDRPVTALRIYLSLAVLLVCLVIAGSILYAGIRGGMRSLGRNPLARGTIFRNLLTVILMAMIVVSVGLFAVYLILKT